MKKNEESSKDKVVAINRLAGRFKGNFENFLRFLRGFFILWNAIGLICEQDLFKGGAA